MHSTLAEKYTIFKDDMSMKTEKRLLTVKQLFFYIKIGGILHVQELWKV